ncbi:OsmC family protein [Numidum massiliense]|uniref:OsmC family protein n=1 Tax=Numidum massiliense TaxID=1522315 RepID=UPI0006D566BE|nr:OsmC family protein [Numidum massiliense]
MAQETFKATAKYTGEGLAVETESRGFKLILDEPKELGGTNKGMNPVEVLLCGLGACQTIVAKAFAPKFGIDLRGFWIELEGDLDTRGFKGKAGVKPGFSEIRYKMHMATDAAPEKVEEFAAFIEKTCPVGDTIATPVPMVSTGVVIEN